MSEIPSPSHKRNQATTDGKQLTSTYSDSAVSLYNETNNNNDSSTLIDLDLAYRK
jgi:hypothetical protein